MALCIRRPSSTVEYFGSIWLFIDGLDPSKNAWIRPDPDPGNWLDSMQQWNIMMQCANVCF